MWPELTIVTSCTGGYGQYLIAWANSIIAQTVKPGRVVLLTHGDADREMGAQVSTCLSMTGIDVNWQHVTSTMDLGAARNFAVSLSRTEWVMHFDCDDTLYPTAVEDFQRLSINADVISAGYTLSGPHLSPSVQSRQRLYHSAVGTDALDLASIASGISPFRRSLWERSPYRTDMLGAWDTALWIGFARLGARFVATTRPAFRYRQHDDSVFNQRRRINGWTRAKTTAQLKALRRGYHGVAVIIPRDMKRNTERETPFQRVRAHYTQHHPEWDVVVGICPSVTWIKGAAVNAGLARTNAETLIIADADCIVDPTALQQSVRAVQDGAPWSMPHHMVYRATRQFTERVCAESADILPGLPFEDACDRRHEGALGGGIVVMQRMLYEAIGGIPLSFIGWGSEDRGLGTIANTLLGPCERGDADLLHLWHPPQSQDASAKNLNVLRTIGTAALRGPDHLAMLLSTTASMRVPGLQSDTQKQIRSQTPMHRPIERPNDVNRRRIP